jgi:hypothetical protein
MQAPLPSTSSTLNVDPAQLALAQKRLTLVRNMKTGVNWFYWIAGLSIINTIIYLTGGTLNFVMGLGMTQVVDAFMSGVAETAARNGTDLALVAQGVGVVVDVLIAGLFILFGVLGNKRKRGWLIAGMVLYTLDMLIFLALQLWVGALFHLVALFGLFQGLRAMNQLRKLETPAPLTPPSVITPM